MIDGYEKCDEQLFGDCRLVMSQQMLGGRGARELRCFVICLFVLRASHGARPSSTLDRVVTKWCKCGSGNPADERNSYDEHDPEGENPFKWSSVMHEPGSDIESDPYSYMRSDIRSDSDTEMKNNDYGSGDDDGRDDDTPQVTKRARCTARSRTRHTRT